MAELINVTQPPLYSEVLELDSKIRDFEIPPLLRMVDNDGVAPPHPVGMQQAMTQLNREQSEYSHSALGHDTDGWPASYPEFAQVLFHVRAQSIR